jgi:large conductance mechanosensitive channel
VKSLVKEFKEFISRGSVLDLAVGIILGVAFKAVIDSFVNDVIMPIIGAIFGKPNFNNMTFDIGSGVVFYGRMLTQVATFVLIGLALFVVVKAFNTFRRNEEKEPESTEKDVLVEIRDLLANRPG